ncbi:phage tail tape measure protein [Corynebacterium belfantii]|uniref:phage tail tape measure protein n=1 Tax=Corynebacterium belfantii TaxID=2014537 RepID=UPI0018D2BE6D|nr:phage tail tape measure protein [Corynebacterium belfantii]MBG9259602.1 phage tail tape measure protein [Corynebacterium belfantii]MBG9266430.1 phage tail tape measure protein [Corynebacterium belfantii]
MDSDATYVPILASFDGFFKSIDKNAGKAGQQAATTFAESMERNLQRAEKAAEKAGTVFERAQNRAADAAAKTQIAELKLLEVKEKQGAKASEVAAAEAKVEKARRDQEAADKAVTKSAKALAVAQDDVAKATQQAGDAMEVNAEKAGLFSKMTGGLGDKLGALPALAAGAVAGFAGFAAIKETLLDVGSAFDSAYDTIRIGTGASGEAFAGLQQSMRNVAANNIGIGDDMAAVGTALADINTRLGLTGAPLEKMTAQMLQLQHMGVDADINAVSQALNGFGIEADAMPAALDSLFQVSQATGLTITELSNSAVKAGPQLRQFGFSMADSAALVGQLDKAGVNADGVLSKMSKALTKFAADGKDAPKALNETIDSIEQLVEAGNSQGAINLAEGIFGAKGAAQFVDAVQTGTLSVDDFMSATGATSDTIAQLAADTADFVEHWHQFKMQAMLAIEPVATAMFNLLTPAVLKVKDGFTATVGFVEGTLVPGFKKIPDVLAVTAQWLDDNRNKLIALAVAVSPIVVPFLVGLAAKWTAAGVAATVSAKKQAQAWVLTKIEAAQASAANIAALWTTGAGWIKAGVQATLGAGQIAGAWLLTKAQSGASIVTSIAAVGIGWVKTGIQALAGAAQVAAAWVIGLGPIAWVTAAIAAVGAGLVWFFTQTETGKQAWQSFTSALQAGWDLFSSALRTGWEMLKTAVFDEWTVRVETLKSVWEATTGAIGAGWEWLKGALHSGWMWISGNVIEGFKAGLSGLRDFFSSVVNGIKSTWATLRSALAKPVNFMINTVYNGGILKAWNVIAGLLPGLKQGNPLAGIPEHAKGGRIAGPGTGTSDDVLMWGSNGEHMLTAKEVQRAGGHNAIYFMRDLIASRTPFTWDGGRFIADHRKSVNDYGSEVKRRGIGNVDDNGLFSMLPKFKDGGAIRPMWELQLENGHKAAKSRNGNPYTWGYEDCSGYMSAIADAILHGGRGRRAWATGSFPGGQPWAPGLGKGFSVGVHDNPGGPGGGHTAGTLTGVGPYSTVNVESGGSHGNVAYGGPAIGADHAQFNGVRPGRFHLAIGADGAFETAGSGGVSPQVQRSMIAKAFGGVISTVMDPIAAKLPSSPPAWQSIPRGVYDSGKDALVKGVDNAVNSIEDSLATVYRGISKIPNLLKEKGPRGIEKKAKIYDRGGILGHGEIAINHGAPERILPPALTASFDKFTTVVPQVADRFGIIADKLLGTKIRETPTAPGSLNAQVDMEKLNDQLSGLHSMADKVVPVLETVNAMGIEGLKGLTHITGAWKEYVSVENSVAKAAEDSKAANEALATARKELADLEREIAKKGPNAKGQAEDSKKLAEARKKVSDAESKAVDSSSELEKALGDVAVGQIKLALSVVSAIAEIGKAIAGAFTAVYEGQSRGWSLVSQMAEEVEKGRQKLSEMRIENANLTIQQIKAINDLRIAQWDTHRAALNGALGIAQAQAELDKRRREGIMLGASGIDAMARAMDRYRKTGIFAIEEVTWYTEEQKRKIKAAEWKVHEARIQSAIDQLDAQGKVELAGLAAAEATLKQHTAVRLLELSAQKLSAQAASFYGVTAQGATALERMNQGKALQGKGAGSIFGGILKGLGGAAGGAAAGFALGGPVGALLGGIGGLLFGGAGQVLNGIAEIKQGRMQESTYKKYAEEELKKLPPEVQKEIHSAGVMGGIASFFGGNGAMIASTPFEAMKIKNQFATWDYEKKLQSMEHDSSIQKQLLATQRAQIEQRLAAQKAALEAERDAAGYHAAAGEADNEGVRQAYDALAQDSARRARDLAETAQRGKSQLDEIVGRLKDLIDRSAANLVNQGINQTVVVKLEKTGRLHTDQDIAKALEETLNAVKGLEGRVEMVEAARAPSALEAAHSQL